jgi:hypothetical protein
MIAVHNLGLPASECAKLEPARPKGHAAAVAEVIRAVPEPAPAAVAAVAARPSRPANHLSGFARA